MLQIDSQTANDTQTKEIKPMYDEKKTTKYILYNTRIEQ